MSKHTSFVELHDAVSDPWYAPDPSYLGSGRRAAPPFPLSSLGTFWAAYVERAAQGASAPPDYVATSLLAVVSALLANVRWPHAGAAWKEAPVPLVLQCRVSWLRQVARCGPAPRPAAARGGGYGS